MATTLDFNIFETNNPKTFGVMDASTYDVNIPVLSPIVHILLPGYSEPSRLHFHPNKVNIYNSNNLGLTDVNDPDDYTELPDGIYTINYSFEPSDPNTVEKKYFRTSALQSKFGKALLKLESDCSTNKEKLNKLFEIEILMYGVSANANICEYNKALAIYSQASKELDQFIKKC